MPSNCSSSDAGSSSFRGDCDPNAQVSYDEFCMILRDRMVDDNQVETNKPKKYSYVSRWRSKVGTADLILTPPSPLYQSFDSPSSPVASVDPSQLCVTSIPPSEYASYSPTSREQVSVGNQVMPTSEFHQLYDDDPDRLFDEISKVESSPEVTYYLPQNSTTTQKSKPARFQNVSSAIRWLPMRIKYSILSQTSHRVLRK